MSWFKMSSFYFNLMLCFGFFSPPQWSRLGVLHCSRPLERFPAVAQSSAVSLPLLHKLLEPKWRSLNHSSTPEGGDAVGLNDLQDKLLRLMGKDKNHLKPFCVAESVHHCIHLPGL